MTSWLGAGPFDTNPWASPNCSILFTDIAAFGDPIRTDHDRGVVRTVLYQVLLETFAESNLSWENCHHADRGDGVLTVVPPSLPTVSIVDPLLALLAAKLKRHNRQANDPIRIQLRAALHVGPVAVDPHGLSGQSIIHTARLLNAPMLTYALARTTADLAVIASTYVYDAVIRHGPGLVDPTTYQRVEFEVKESKMTAWIHLAGNNTESIHWLHSASRTA
jgi:hypothetical protein